MMFQIVAIALLFGVATAADLYKAPSSVPPAYSANSKTVPYSAPPANPPAAYNNPPAYNKPSATPSPSYQPSYQPSYKAPQTYGSQPTYNGPQTYAKQPAYNGPLPYGNQAYIGPQPYANYDVPSYLPKDLNAELAEVSEDIADLTAKASKLNSIVEGNAKSIKEISEFRSNVEGEIAPSVESLIKSQNYKIKEYREQLGELQVLKDEVEQLAQKVTDVRKLIIFNRERRVVLRTKIGELQIADEIQDIDISALVKLVATEAKRLIEVKGLIYDNKVKASEVSDNLDAVLNVINKEKAEKFTVELSREKPSVTYNFASAFASVPDVQYGIIAIKLEKENEKYNSYGKKDGYNSYDQNSYDQKSYDKNSYDQNSYDKNSYELESWNIKVSAQATTTSVTVSLNDVSQQWSVERILVRLVAKLTDNGILEYSSKKY